jgi:hypothetical protein
MSGPGAIGSLELGMTVHLFGGSHDGEDVQLLRSQIGRPLTARPVAAGRTQLPLETYVPVTLHPLLPAWLRARWLAYAVPEAVQQVRDGSLVVWVLAQLPCRHVPTWRRGPAPSCSCRPAEGCDAEGSPGCAYCQTADSELPCPADRPA